MKKVLLAALILTVISSVVNAQTGSLLVGGSIDFSSIKSPNNSASTKSSTFDFNPTVGYQLSDNWTVGLVADIGSSRNTSSSGIIPDTYTVKDNSFTIGPFVRYAKSISNIFAVYGQLQSGFGSSNSDGFKTNIATVSAFPAIFINVKDGFGLNFTVGGIGYSSSKPSGESASSSFNLTFGKTVGIGISKNFGLRKKK